MTNSFAQSASSVKPGRPIAASQRAGRGSPQQLPNFRIRGAPFSPSSAQRDAASKLRKKLGVQKCCLRTSHWEAPTRSRQRAAATLLGFISSAGPPLLAEVGHTCAASPSGLQPWLPMESFHRADEGTEREPGHRDWSLRRCSASARSPSPGSANHIGLVDLHA